MITLYLSPAKNASERIAVFQKQANLTDSTPPHLHIACAGEDTHIHFIKLENNFEFI